MSTHFSARCRLPLLTVLAVSLSAPRALGEFPVTFEAPTETSQWQLADYDIRPRAAKVNRVFDYAHSGSGSEQIRIWAGRGSFVHYTYPVNPIRVHGDLLPMIWVASDRTGIEFKAVVVLPRSKHPRSGQPIKTVIAGETYARMGGWQKLLIRQPDRLLRTQVQRLQNQFNRRYGSTFQLDVREAYIDRFVLNVYGGTGVTTVWVDDLDVRGTVTTVSRRGTMDRSLHATSYGPAAPSRSAPAMTDRPSAQIHGSVLTAKGAAFFPRAVEHNGESFAWLREQGFNTIKLRVSPTREQLREARELKLWLIAPPPYLASGETLHSEYDVVLAWSLGKRLTPHELESTRNLANDLRRFDGRRRPLVCNAHSGLWDYSGFVDILLLAPDPVASSFEMASVLRWARERQRLARFDKSFWGYVQTQPSERLTSQLVALGIGGGESFGIDPEQIRLLTYSLIAAGVRGVCFKSRTRLDSTDDATKLRASMLRLLNLELQLIERWTATGRHAETIETDSGNAVISHLQTKRARLLIALRQSRQQQYVVSPPESDWVSFDLYDVPVTDRVYRVTLLGPQEVHRKDGVRISLRNAENVTLLFATENDGARNYVARYLAQHGETMAKLRAGILRESFRQLQTVLRALHAVSRAVPQADGWLSRISLDLDQTQRLLHAGDLTAASAFGAAAAAKIAQIRRAHWEQATQTFTTPVASPYCALFDTLPLHWKLAEGLGRGAWGPDVLAAGNFESLDHMLRTGWKQSQAQIQGVETAVELSLDAPHGGRSALRLQARATAAGSAPAVLEDTPITITSAPLPVRAGQVLRISGWVRLGGQIMGDGLMIYDSFGGIPLAHRITSPSGWRRFSMYRAATNDGPLVLFFCLKGLGQASIDDVSVSLLNAAPEQVAPPGRPAGGRVSRRR